MRVEIAINGEFKTQDNVYRCCITDGKFEFRFIDKEPRIMGVDIDKCDSIVIESRESHGSDWGLPTEFDTPSPK